MNQNQKRILMAVIAVVVAMLAFPPFQVVAPNGAVLNMGYDWLLDPPERGYIVATVNVSMLLIQWIGVLVVGGIAFFLAKSSAQKEQISEAPSVHKPPNHKVPQPHTVVEEATAVAPPPTFFRDPTQLTQWLRYFLYASIVIDVIALLSGVLQYQLLSDFKLGIYSSGELATAAADANDQRQKVVGSFQVGVAIITIILFAMWIYRANFNVRSLGAQNMKFTPGWSVGYYFIPILNLWRPYQAMKEIWKASKNPTSWESEDHSAILPWWWFFFLVASIIGNASFRASMSANEIHELITSTVITIASDVVSIPATIIALILVGKIHEMQISHVQHRI
jgi:heme/copper-type cytochrome/quinol oxidase subunit 2